MREREREKEREREREREREKERDAQRAYYIFRKFFENCVAVHTRQPATKIRVLMNIFIN